MSVEELLAASKSRIENILEPINGGVGEDISYDDRFEELKNETEKLSSLTGETVSWGTITEISEELLTEKSKDFRLVCYLAAAKAQEHTLEAALDSLVMIIEFAHAFWEEMYPPLRRIRARANMLGWYGDRCEDLKDLKLTPKDGDIVKAIDETSKALDSEFREKFGDAYPGISGMRESARHLIRVCPKEAPKPKPEEKKPGATPAKPAAVPAAVAAASTADAPAANPSAINDADQATQAIPQVGRLLARMGMMFRKGKPEDPLAYRFGRMGMWMTLKQAPPATEGKTIVPPPPDGLKTRFDALASANDWLTLLNEADDNAGQFILWLDPHRYVSTAMDRLGALFLKAKEALILEVALMLKRAPTLPDLAFSTGVPFADGQTKMWLENEVAAALGDGEGGGGGGGGGGGPSVLDEPLKEARDLVVGGKLPEAIDVITTAAASAPTPAERFRGKLALAQLCLQSGQFAIARAQLEGLSDQIQKHDLMAWEPGLCAEVYAALFTAHTGANTGQTIPPEALAAQRDAFELLCQLDPGTALKLAKK